MNVILQTFDLDKENDGTKMKYLNFMPRKYLSEQFVNLSNDDSRKKFVEKLRDSSERMKVWAYLLAKKADEIENGVYDKTTVYYPEIEEYYDDGNKTSNK